MFVSTAVHDHYQTLGLSSQASTDDIKKAFRKLALSYHPDRHAAPSLCASQVCVFGLCAPR